MKKLSIYIVAGLFLIAGFSSCQKEYLDTKPTDQVASSDVFATTDNAYAAINGIYRSLYIQWLGNQDQGGISGNMIYMDMMGEDLVNTTRGNGWFISEYQWLSHRNVNSRVPKFNYFFFYSIAGNASMIINNIDNSVGADADKKLIKGEALAARAWAYFNMVQMFGQRFDAGSDNSSPGVPLVLNNEIEGQPRASVAEVYTQINKDLDDAISNLTGAQARPNTSHINVNVAKGFKARVALTQQNWPLAVQMAHEARQGFSLMSNDDYMAGFNDYNNGEWMWGVHQQSDQTTYFYSLFAYMSCNFSSTNIRTNPKAINSKLYDMISETDIRKQLWDPTGTNTDFPIPTSASTRKPYMNRKFMSESSSLSIGDVPLMRAAEMYLIEAEALARQGGHDGEAAQVLYELAVNRDPDYVLSTNTGQDLIDEIMIQRRVELWGEGFRWYDLKRLNLPLDRNGANHDASLCRILDYPAGGKEWQFLIPQDEINANKACEQNPL